VEGLGVLWQSTAWVIVHLLFQYGDQGMPNSQQHLCLTLRLGKRTISLGVMVFPSHGLITCKNTKAPTFKKILVILPIIQ
jgi:hypothetical protein